MLTQEQLIQTFTSGGVNATPQNHQAPPPQTGVPIESFHHHLEAHKQTETAIAQHFDVIYQEIAAIQSFQRWIVVIQGGVMIFLIIFLMMFFPIWEQWQKQRSVSSVSQTPISLLPAQTR